MTVTMDAFTEFHDTAAFSSGPPAVLVTLATNWCWPPTVRCTIDESSAIAAGCAGEFVISFGSSWPPQAPTHASVSTAAPIGPNNPQRLDMRPGLG